MVAREQNALISLISNAINTLARRSAGPVPPEIGMRAGAPVQSLALPDHSPSRISNRKLTIHRRCLPYDTTCKSACDTWLNVVRTFALA